MFRSFFLNDVKRAVDYPTKFNYYFSLKDSDFIVDNGFITLNTKYATQENAGIPFLWQEYSARKLPIIPNLALYYEYCWGRHLSIETFDSLERWVESNFPQLKYRNYRECLFQHLIMLNYSKYTNKFLLVENAR